MGGDYLRSAALRDARVIERVNAEFVPVWINIRTTPVPPFPFVRDVLVTASIDKHNRVTDMWSRNYYVHSVVVSPDGQTLLNPSASTVAKTAHTLVFDGDFGVLDHRSGRLSQHARARAAPLPSGRGAGGQLKHQPRRRAGSGSSATSAGALTRGSGWVRDKSAPAMMMTAPTGAFHDSCSPRPSDADGDRDDGDEVGHRRGDGRAREANERVHEHVGDAGAEGAEREDREHHARRQLAGMCVANGSTSAS